MRTEDQIKRKINDFMLMLNEPRDRNSQILIETSIEILEWVLNEPTGEYHE